MWSDNEILDAVAGRIDAPALWRLQFWIWVAFSRSSVFMLEGDAQGAIGYLWVLSSAQSKAIALQPDLSQLEAHPFYLQDACKLSPAQALHWHNWPFFRVGDVVEEVDEQTRDGIWMTLRSFDGSTSHHADLTNPDEKLQPLRWQAQNEVCDLLDRLCNWKQMIADSSQVGRTQR